MFFVLPCQEQTLFPGCSWFFFLPIWFLLYSEVFVLVNRLFLQGGFSYQFDSSWIWKSLSLFPSWSLREVFLTNLVPLVLGVLVLVAGPDLLKVGHDVVTPEQHINILVNPSHVATILSLLDNAYCTVDIIQQV